MAHRGLGCFEIGLACYQQLVRDLFPPVRGQSRLSRSAPSGRFIAMARLSPVAARRRDD
ncbi:hypothetical protein PCL1606_19210 [Pseudomonas chlororaphis]|uniref:Uncharacterized protein n=1 Tax=Pseudomonas chlororaphis TaxID=587753 RepID=A0A0D5XXC0_9PSED|nr:hypothetical protein PCL1606_19210 [Pseudomonas chlororaphis]